MNKKVRASIILFAVLAVTAVIIIHVVGFHKIIGDNLSKMMQTEELDPNAPYPGDDYEAPQVITNAVMNKETALKIGRALLEECFPDSFANKKVELNAVEQDGIWKVYNVVERERKLWNGQTANSYGGGIYVKFRESTGEVIRIGVND